MNGLAEALRESASESLTLGRRREALLLLTKLFLIDPVDLTNFINLCDLCQLDNQWIELEQFAMLRLSHLPDDAEALCRLANVSMFRKQFTNALDYFQQAIIFNPRHVKALIELSRVQKRFGDIKGSISSLQAAVQIDPDLPTAQDNLVYAHLFSDNISPEELFTAHLNRSARYNFIHPAPPSPRLSGKIRIGYVSPDFREHSVASFIEPVIRSHDRSRFEMYCYHAHPEQDETTARFRAMPVQWRDIADLDDAKASALIRNDEIHILVDLAGYTAWNRLSLFALRPAQVQITWLGYPHSTGMTAMDYRISDTIADPPGMTEQFHTEQLLRLEGPFLCFQQHESFEPRQTSPFMHNNGQVTFASFNNLAKASPSIVTCWRKILHALPHSRLLLKSEIFADPDATVMAMNLLRLDGSRVITLASTPDRGSHLAFYNQVDIALDTFPYNGTTTTCEALSMGVPVISLAGRNHAARVGASILESIGHAELVAGTADEYVKIAVDLANDPNRLNILHRTLPQELQRSPLTDAERFTAELEGKCIEIMGKFSDSGEGRRQ